MSTFDVELTCTWMQVHKRREGGRGATVLRSWQRGKQHGKLRRFPRFSFPLFKFRCRFERMGVHARLFGYISQHVRRTCVTSAVCARARVCMCNSDPIQFIVTRTKSVVSMMKK